MRECQGRCLCVWCDVPLCCSEWWGWKCLCVYKCMRVLGFRYALSIGNYKSQCAARKSCCGFVQEAGIIVFKPYGAERCPT